MILHLRPRHEDPRFLCAWLGLSWAEALHYVKELQQ